MHPYVYKKHHKPHQLIVLVILFYTMILCQPSSSSSCNFAVKKIKIFSDFTKGHIRIEGNNVNASVCKHNCMDQDVIKKNFLYKVTIDKHYMLLYHIQSEKFICWNKSFKKLVARRNPTNLTYCKFEDNLSKIPDFRGSKIRYTTRDEKNREIEIRFNKSGAFPRPRWILKCVKKYKLDHRLGLNPKEFLKLDPSQMYENSKEMDAYRWLMKKCANPDFLPSDVDQCTSGLGDFCGKMKHLRDLGHNITSEIVDLCKNEWKY